MKTKEKMRGMIESIRQIEEINIPSDAEKELDAYVQAISWCMEE